MPDRRAFLAAGAGLVVAAACSGGGDRTGPASEGEGFSLIASFPRTEPFAASGSPQRLPLLIAASDGAPLDRIDGPVEFSVEVEGGRTVGSPVEVRPRSEGLSRAYLPLEVTFPEPGLYWIVGDYRGSELRAAIQAYEPDQVPIPQVGTPFPYPSTPTESNPEGVSPLCTADPPCPLHRADLATVGRGGPVALLVSTPRYCATAICGPVLDFLVEAAAERPDLAAVHAEVYANPAAVTDISRAEPAPVVTALGLTYEPALFVVRGDGTLAARLDTIFDRSELEERLALV